MFNKEKVIFRFLAFSSPFLPIWVGIMGSWAFQFNPLTMIPWLIFLLGIIPALYYLSWWILRGRKLGEPISKRILYFFIFIIGINTLIIFNTLV